MNLESNFYKLPEIESKHSFLCEELLSPRAQCSDAQRLNLFSNHINQFVHLCTPEIPRVFTNFENQIGDYSIAKREAKKKFKIIKKIVKNKFNYDLLVQYDDGEYDLLHHRTAVNISEAYGYKMNDRIPDKKEGDTVEAGTQLFSSDNYDENGNFAYGVNLRAVFFQYKNKNYEDGIVLTESAAKKLSSYKVENSLISVNNNDIFLNLYGDEKNYKSFPRVGEETKGNILVASRRLDYKKVLFDFQNEALRKVDNLTDEITFSGGGKIVDIDIYPNVPLEILKNRKNEFCAELVEIYEAEMKYYQELRTELEKIIPKKVLSERERSLMKSEDGIYDVPIPKSENPNKYTDEVGYYWKLSHEWLDENIQWRYDTKTFENLKLKFTILEESPVKIGSKITGRYGNKGVVTEIIPDSEAPINEFGERAEVLLNSLGVLNRMNISQIQNQYLTFTSNNLVRLIKKTDDYSERKNLLKKYFDIVNREQGVFLIEKIEQMTEREKQQFYEEMFENGLYIHQSPFFDNMSFDDFINLFREFPEICQKYKCEGIENELVMGEMYFILLKHNVSNKTSLRSSSLTNIKNLPSKSTLKKTNKVLFSSTPIRVGEMETNNLLISNNGSVVEKLLKSYSTSEEDRENLIEQLLTKDDPFDIDYELVENQSIARKILNKFFNVLDLELED